MAFVKIESKIKKFARGTQAVSVDKDQTTLLLYAALLVYLDWKLPCFVNLYWDQEAEIIALEGPLKSGEFLLSNRGTLKLQPFLRENKIKPGMYEPQFPKPRSHMEFYSFIIPVKVGE